jgi:hippurate hydrolase
MSAAQLSQWTKAAEAGRDELVALRREIHAEPELGLDCRRTRDKLEAALANLPLAIRHSDRTSGFIAELEGARPGRTVLLRGDMDALPIQEATGLDFASREAGKMHACGHDSHSAMLASAARILCARRKKSLAASCSCSSRRGGASRRQDYDGRGTARRPAARRRLRPAYLADIAARRSRLPRGRHARFDRHAKARIVGKGGHAAMPHDAIDPVPVAAEVVLALQSEVARRTPVTDPIVLSITSIHAGTTHNVLPDAVELLGTLRTLSPEARNRGRGAFERICQPCRGGAWLHRRSGD